MSLPWNKTVRLRIGANSVQGTVHPAWSPRRVLATCLHNAAQASSANPASPTLVSTAPFDAAMAATLSELGAVRNSRVKNAQILLADTRVHFDVVSGDYANLSERQLQAIAQACLTEILGDRALAFVVRWDLQKDAQHLVIAAIESRDIEMAERVAGDHGITPISLQPDFCGVWNRFASALHHKMAIFAAVDEHHVVVALVISGSITALSCGSVLLLAFDAGDSAIQKNAIDDRVDRLLSSTGLDPAHIQAFLLVAPSGVGHGLNTRWQVLDSPAEAA